MKYEITNYGRPAYQIRADIIFLSCGFIFFLLPFFLIYQPDFIYLAALRLDKMTMTYK